MPNLSDHEINKILEDYQDYFRKRLKKRLPENYNMPFRMTEDDFLQEVLIKMWQLLQNKYDPEKGTINTFVTSHIDICIKSVIRTITNSLYHTGKDLTKPVRRTQMRNLQKNSISLDRLADNNRFSNNDNFYHSSDFADHFLYTQGIQSLNSSEEIDYEIDKQIISAEIKKRLNKELRVIYGLFFIKGYSQDEVSEIIGKSQGTVSKSIAKINDMIRAIHTDFGY